jgi:hypothetical protein
LCLSVMEPEPRKPVGAITTIHNTRTGRINKAKKELKIWNCE